MAKGFSLGTSGTSTSTDTTARASASAAQTAINDITAQAAENIAAGQVVLGAGKIWRNDTAAAIKVPANVTATDMKAAGFTEQEQAVAANPEVLLSASTDLTGAAATGLKYGVRLDTGAEFVVSAGNWIAKPVGADNNAFHYPVNRSSTSAAAPTVAETRATPQEGDTAKVQTTDGTVRNWRYESGAWVLKLTESHSAVATLRLANGGTPLAGGVYVQVVGASHVAPTLAAGERTTVINMQADGSTVETSYLHDATAQITSQIRSSSESGVTAWAASSAVPVNALRRITLHNAIVTMLSNSARTTGATFDATEAANWTYIGQSSRSNVINAGEVMLTGQSIFVNGYERIATVTKAYASTGDTDLRVIADDSIRTYTVGEVVQFGNPRVASLGSQDVVLRRSAASGVATAALSVAELANWTLVAQPLIPTVYPVGALIPRGWKFALSGVIYECNVAHVTASTFDATEQAKWNVIAGNPNLSIAGQFIGSAATYAGLPTTSAATGNATNGDWAYLTADVVGSGTALAPEYPRGVYIHNGTNYAFAFTVSFGAAMAIADWQTRTTVERPISGEVLSDIMRLDDRNRHAHYQTAIDFDAMHTNALGREVRVFSFTGSTALTNAPQPGAALGVIGHGFYCGDDQNGQQFVYFLKDSLGRETEYYRERSASTWTAWQAVSSDGWQGSQNDMQISSGMHVVIADGHKVHFLASDRTRAIRLIPDSDWSNVGTITPGNSWTFDGDFPTAGRQEVVLVPAPVADVWNVSAVIASDAKKAFIQRTTNTGSSAPSDTEFASPANGDAVNVILGNGTTEVWKYADDAWTLTSTIPANPVSIPTVQAGLGAAVKIDDYGRPSNFHLNSANGAVTWAVAGAPDGVWHYVTNTGTVDATVAFTGHKNVYLRDGRANTDLGATLTAKPGEQYLVHVTKNGEDRFVNAARLSAATGAAARTITGSATATGYDDVAVPVSITLAAGKALDTVTATNGALVTSINSLLGTCMVMAKGQNTVLSHTTKNAVAYNGLQRVGDKDFALALLTTTATDYTLDVTLQEGDLLEIVENYNNNTANDHVHWARVITGRGYISYQYPSSTNGLKIQFPATLDNKIKLNSEGQTNQRLVKIRVWRDAANGFVVPTGTEVRTACTVTCNAGAVNVNGGPETTAYAGTSMRVSIALPAGQRLDTVTVNNGATVAIADLFTGTVELAVPKGTTGAIVLTATFTPIVARVARSITNADGGVAVPCGTIEVRLPASGNRSIQMRSVLGTLTCRAATIWADGGNTANIVTSLTTAWTYVNSTWNFTTAGQWQDLLFIDQTNNRTYRVKMTIGASYNANQFWIEEMLE